MERFKERWEITNNWQLLFPILGVLMTAGAAYLFARRFLNLFQLNDSSFEWLFLIGVSLLLYFVMVKCCLWCFQKLEKRWVTEFKWEMIAIFIVFAVTGSSAARLAGPLTHAIGIDYDTTNPWIYWPVRIFVILPIYQILLLAFGWLFGQFRFFWEFEKKMLKRMGLGRFIN